MAALRLPMEISPLLCLPLELRQMILDYFIPVHIRLNLTGPTKLNEREPDEAYMILGLCICGQLRVDLLDHVRRNCLVTYKLHWGNRRPLNKIKTLAQCWKGTIFDPMLSRHVRLVLGPMATPEAERASKSGPRDKERQVDGFMKELSVFIRAFCGSLRAATRIDVLLDFRNVANCGTRYEVVGIARPIQTGADWSPSLADIDAYMTAARGYVAKEKPNARVDLELSVGQAWFRQNMGWAEARRVHRLQCIYRYDCGRLICRGVVCLDCKESDNGSPSFWTPAQVVPDDDDGWSNRFCEHAGNAWRSKFVARMIGGYKEKSLELSDPGFWFKPKRPSKSVVS